MKATPLIYLFLSVSQQSDVDLESSFQDDEDYDVVEVRNEKLVTRINSTTESVYDVPRNKMSSSMNLRKSQSTFNLNFPDPSPRKLEPLSLPTSPLRPQCPEISTKTSATSANDVARKLFDEEDEEKLKPCQDFSSKTLRPKRNVEPYDSRRFRPRNKSLSLKQPEEVTNELASILERRRLNIESHETKPAVTEKPKNISFSGPKNISLPTYSTINKISRNKVNSDNMSSERIYNNDLRPNQSFLHSFANSPRFKDNSTIIDRSW